MVMTVGLAFFYGGLVRPKNALNTMMMSVVALGVVSVQWVLVGYSIAFGHARPGGAGSRGWASRVWASSPMPRTVPPSRCRRTRCSS